MVKHRSSERGAALFVVVLVVTLLTAIGAFAMHATSLAQLGSGYSRRAAAALYLAEMATNLRVATIADNGRDLSDRGNHTGFYAGTTPDDCREIERLKPLVLAIAPDKKPFCAAMDANAAVLAVNTLNPGLASDPEGFFGAMSRPDSPLDQSVMGSVRVEVTDEVNAPPSPGMPPNGHEKQVTLTVTGSLVPFSAGANSCTAPVTRASEAQRLRAFVNYIDNQ